LKKLPLRPKVQLFAIMFCVLAVLLLMAEHVSEGTRKLDANGCAVGDSMQGVHEASSRLEVLDPCITVVGIVRNDFSRGDDGDQTFGLYVSGDDMRLVNSGNYAKYDGALHIEIVPFDQKNVSLPKPGDRVRITGAWVSDFRHGHNEIHPVFRLEVLFSPLSPSSPLPQLNLNFKAASWRLFFSNGSTYAMTASETDHYLYRS